MISQISARSKDEDGNEKAEEPIYLVKNGAQLRHRHVQSCEERLTEVVFCYQISRTIKGHDR